MKMLFYLDEQTHERLRKVAFKERISMSEIIRDALEQWLQKRRGKKGGKR